MRRISRLFVAGASVCLACAGAGTALGSSNPPATKVVAVNQDFDLSAGQTAVIDGAALTVSLVKVAEDSRCPEGVQCVWAGNGAVTLAASTPVTGKTTVTLNTTLPPHTVKAGPYEISLVGLKPYPKQGLTIPPASYVATLHITRQ